MIFWYKNKNNKMEIKTITFDTIIRTYQPYVDAAKSIENDKAEHLKKMEDFKSKMQSIYNSTQNLVLDDKTKNDKMEEFAKIQNEAQQLDNNFRTSLANNQNEIMKNIYSDVNQIVKDYSIQNSIDLVISDTEIVYQNDGLNITNDIVEIVKSKGLYTPELLKQ